MDKEYQCIFKKFLVRDLVLDKIVEHPTVTDDLDLLLIHWAQEANFAIDQFGRLIVIDGWGRYVPASERYKVEYPAGA